ncbi:MAG: hypothetical protein HRU50_13890 [Winogradskyella sp.]|uniref:hypothetical protein n=1 Tax=Winogradskyella sp. TaxID=1883156 RepID=UPI0025DAC987|nr:hypothetical protein [Winogradskyella sp.]NRB61017.1 hypothetical protein [Winogradskyella sp.]
MKNSICVFLITVVFCSCDPVSDMEADIENLTTQDLILEFISVDQNLSKTLAIPIEETRRFQEAFDVGNDFLEPSLIEYDSVVVKNSIDQILKIYKPDSSGKNIYNIGGYWISSEPYKRGFRNEYKIYDEDLE